MCAMFFLTFYFEQILNLQKVAKIVRCSCRPLWTSPKVITSGIYSTIIKSIKLTSGSKTVSEYFARNRAERNQEIFLGFPMICRIRRMSKPPGAFFLNHKNFSFFSLKIESYYIITHSGIQLTGNSTFW